MDLICFDLDNTLVDSVKAHAKSYNRALKIFGFKTVSQKGYFSLLGRPKEELIKLLVPNASNKVREEIKRLHDKYLANEYYIYARRFNYSLNILSFLRRKRYKVVITSNCSRDNIYVILKGTGIGKKYFDGLIGNDDVKRSKPYPDEILKAGKLFNTKPKFVVGDSIFDIIAAKRAKVKTIAVTTGYYKTKELKKYKPNYIIKNLKELEKIL